MFFFRQVLEEKADVPKAHFRRGEAYFQLKDYDLAMKDFDKVIELDPGNRAAKNKVSLCLQVRSNVTIEMPIIHFSILV